MNNRVAFASLGCPKALVDSERIITQLKAQGYDIGPDFKDAGVVLINTCGFIESAVEESMATIKEAMDQNGKVLVTGCLGAKADMLKKHFPDLLHISGPHAYEQVVGAVHEHLPLEKNVFTSLIPPEGIKLTPRHYAYLKISEGCNHKCTFCIIPSMRGKLQSYPVNQVLEEAKRLADAGVKELLIISQDTPAYGLDKKYETKEWRGKTIETRFSSLCEALGDLGIWIRLHYVYPYPHVDKVIPLMAAGKILPYLDIPLQHASIKILKAMKRPAATENTLARIKSWREICPELTIRSSFIVGFPGETEADFEELLDFLTEAQLDRVGCFKYSNVEGARSNDLADHVDQEVIDERYERFMSHQMEISKARLQQKIGTDIEVIIDSQDDDGYIARSKADAPEIDGQVYLPFHDDVKIGDIVEVTVTDADEYDLYAEF